MSTPRKPVKILVSRAVMNALASRIDALAKQYGRPLHVVPLDAVNATADLDGGEIAYFSRDMYERPAGGLAESPVRRFFSFVREAPDLKWLHIFSSGADRPVYAELSARGVLTTTSAGANSRSVALMALTGLLALNRKLPRHFRNQSARAWQAAKLDEFSESLEGQRVVVIGTGHVGTEVARLMKVFGLWSIGLNRTGRFAPFFDEVLPVDCLERVASKASWLIVCCPLNPSTRHIVDARILAALPAHSHIINVGRGGVIDEVALVKALQAKRVAGAHLDVFDTEPLSNHSPLWSMDNVIVTPHAAAHGQEVLAAANDMFIGNLRNWLVGAPMRNAYRFGDPVC